MKEGGEKVVHNQEPTHTPLGRGLQRVPNRETQMRPSGQPPPNEKVSPPHTKRMSTRRRQGEESHPRGWKRKSTKPRSKEAKRTTTDQQAIREQGILHQKVMIEKRWDPKIELARKTVQYQHVTETNKEKEDIGEECVRTDFELSIGMPRHLMNHEEFKNNYPREERGGREDTSKAVEYGTISRQESGVYTGGDTNGDGIQEMKARERCLEQRWKKMLDRQCMEEKRRGALVCNLVVDAEKRIAAHENVLPGGCQLLERITTSMFPYTS